MLLLLLLTLALVANGDPPRDLKSNRCPQIFCVCVCVCVCVVGVLHSFLEREGAGEGKKGERHGIGLRIA